MKFMKQKGLGGQGGFTLLELLVVIAIIGILVAIGTVSYSAAQARARDSRRRQDMETIAKALEQYNADNAGNYPGNCADAVTYIVGGAMPTDPKTGSGYTDLTCYDELGADPNTFCICAEMEVDGTGNYYTNGCATSGTSKDYFCRENQQ